MKKKISLLIISILSVFLFTNVFAQKIDKEKQSQEEKEKLDEMRKRIITLRVNLTDEQAPPFWLIYEDYSKEKTKTSLALGKLRRTARTQSDAELKENFKKRFSLREDEIAIERKYFDKFLTVLSIRQVLEFYQAEKHLRKKIMKHFRDRFKEFEKKERKAKEENDDDFD